MRERIKQFMCGVFTNHSLADANLQSKLNKSDGTYTFTNTCCNCGKKLSFTVPAKSLDRRFSNEHQRSI